MEPFVENRPHKGCQSVEPERTPCMFSQFASAFCRERRSGKEESPGAHHQYYEEEAEGLVLSSARITHGTKLLFKELEIES